ncbi:sulfurtransferase TusA family protein [Nisaea acidiphila]|uniref:Sulfurtransferase TusA family protein n=1 Tax=Nisaea acidiphila TaxID=1862145 RepID=A0A9J7AY91_9PROT|nr:sulfurtransferase TusA family protein [Nisaea acidiphila]UUX51236.1 sulfurtransferase TusA family protein [Nisaea acidiphila]
MSEPALTLDASGLKCPLPVLKARKAIKGLEAGQTISVHSTDPASPLDFKHFCNSSGHELVSEAESEGTFTFLIRKGA